MILSYTQQYNAEHSHQPTCQLGHWKDHNLLIETSSSVGGANSCVSSRSSGVVRIELRHCLIRYTKPGGTLMIERNCKKAAHIFSRCALIVGAIFTMEFSCLANIFTVNWNASVLDGMIAHWRRLDAASKEACASWDGRWKPMSIVATLRLSKSIPA